MSALSLKLMGGSELLSRDPMRKVLKHMIFTSVVRRTQELLVLAAREDGQALVEYALLISLVALVAFGSVDVFGHGVSHLYSNITSLVP